VTASGLPHRDDLTQRTEETWRPPLFRSSSSVWAGALARLRRAADLQAASIWRDLSQLLPGCRGALLDVGCGAQPYRPLCHPDVRFVGIDTSDALHHFGYAAPDTTYYSGDTWPMPDASFETILATETLEHVARPATFLAEAKRCLAPGGRLILTVPFAARWHFIPHDYWRFTPSGLRQLLRDAGFAEAAVFARGNEMTVACYKIVTLVLAWLVGATGGLSNTWGKRFVAFALLPLAALAAGVGQISLLATRGGDDCLGYTVVARPDASGKPAGPGIRHEN
jgi:SAM-dependent methyltransferase